MQPAAPLHLFSAERLIDETSTFKDFEFNLIGSPWMKSTTFELTTSVCDIPMYPSRRWRIHHVQFSIMRISENLCFSMSFHGNVWPPKGIWWYLARGSYIMIPYIIYPGVASASRTHSAPSTSNVHSLPLGSPSCRRFHTTKVVKSQPSGLHRTSWSTC